MGSTTRTPWTPEEVVHMMPITADKRSHLPQSSPRQAR